MPRGRKGLMQSALEGRLDELHDGHALMRVLSLRGSNLIEVEDQEGKNTLCMLPAKFNKSLWIGKGSYVIVDVGQHEKAQEAGNKVTGIITRVLFREQLRILRKSPMWSGYFDDAKEETEVSGTIETPEEEKGAVIALSEEYEDEDEDDGLPPLHQNCNRHSSYQASDEDTDSEEDAPLK